MPGRRDRDTLDINDVADAALRKNIFREFGKDLSSSIRSGYQTDVPGSIARLMEKAFRAGLALGSDPSFEPTKKSDTRPITDMDVPSLPRQQLAYIRIALGIDPYGRVPARPQPTRPEALVVFMRPRDPGLPSTMSRDGWFHVGGVDAEGLSNKVVNPYIKLGLYDEPFEVGGGWRIAVMTEWGYELMLKGRTNGPKDRSPGTSSTYSAYRALIGDDPWVVVQRAGKLLGLTK
ncbi:hypothetical protein G6L37_04745 [Agrobacterium rubi]|nr:hypothetical protein [Agrobacterium rubi]NTF24662.1 hypothetical protein [Agrobacterium rubi]